MTRLILNRLLFGLITLFAVSVVVFLATQTLPGDAARAILGREATPERLDAMREQLHLYDPLVVQYGKWLAGVATLDFGQSFAAGLPVGEYLAPRVSNSLWLMGFAAIIATPVALALGAYSALRRDKGTDHATSMGTLILASLPEFAVGIVLILVFSTGWLRLFPPVFGGGAGAVWQYPDQLVLPVLTLALAVSPPIVRMMRASMIEVLESEYVQQARLKGLPERTVIWRHAAPNAIGPVAQVIALQLAWLAGGVVAIEYLFRFPGIGLALMDAITTRDLP